MSQASYNSLALHEIVLSIADSLNEAQEQLRSMPPYDEYGRPNTLYQLPYLDFNLEVISQFEATETSGGTTNPGGSAIRTGGISTSPALNAIRFVPFRSTETTSKNLGSITSTISGRFVAVMPNEGLPQVLLKGSSKPYGTDSQYATFLISIQAVQPTNDFVPGQRIELNFDETTSLELNSGVNLKTPIFLDPKDGYTSKGDGTFLVKVKLDLTEYNAGRTFVFVANSGTQFTSIAISKP